MSSTSPPLVAASSRSGLLHTGRMLNLLNLYRLLVAAGFVVLAATELLPMAQSALLYDFSLLYLLLSAAAIYPLSINKLAPQHQLALGLTLDILFVVLLMHAAGGISTGISSLLVISIIGAGLISGGRITIFFAALATLATLAEQVFAGWRGLPDHVNYLLAAMWGMALFATAVFAHVLSLQLRASEALVQQRGLDLANMAQLTDYVIEQMDTGVIVLDVDGSVRLMNRAVQQLLQITPSSPQRPLKHYSPELGRALRQWRNHGPGSRVRHLIETSSKPLSVQYRRMNPDDQSALLFIDDAGSAAVQAQQLKLAAWGRLTASMAHEIRNPLGAISHAAALLEESPDLTAPDQRLTRIVRTHAQRINELVESVMQLGQRDRNDPEVINLANWLPRFVHEFTEMHPGTRQQLVLEPSAYGLYTWFDLGQLQQILINLCRNGIEHGAQHDKAARVTLRSGLLPGDRVYIDVLDTGPGVSPDNREKLFSPFFTTRAEGTGLGLYLSRELALANQGDIFYRPTEDGTSCFRLVLAADTANNDTANNSESAR